MPTLTRGGGYQNDKMKAQQDTHIPKKNATNTVTASNTTITTTTNTTTTVDPKKETPLRKLKLGDKTSESFYPSNMMPQFQPNNMMPMQAMMQGIDGNPDQQTNNVPVGQQTAPLVEKSKAITPALLEQKKAEAAEK